MPSSTNLISTLSHYGAAHEKSSTVQHQKLLKQSKKLVAQTFFGTMLKQMRNSPFKSKMFDGGRGGEAFSSMLDQNLAERMANAKSGQRLANAMANRLETDAQKRLNAKEENKPHKKTAAEALFEQSSYKKPALRDGRKNVPADIRA